MYLLRCAVAPVATRRGATCPEAPQHESKSLAKLIDLKNMTNLCILLFACLVAVTTVHAQTATTTPLDRQVAITIDDLPVNGASEAHGWITEKLVAAVVRHEVPAIGFVNEGKLYADGELVPERVALLQQWIDAGLELGNHQYAHANLHRTPLATYQQGILRGETVTRQLMEDAGQTLRYFRHPYLRTGETLGKRDSLHAFLAAHGYEVAPVSIDNSEWIFASAYERAAQREDTAQMTRIAEAYIPYMNAKFAYFEQQEQDFLGRTMKHTLLLHANRLNADHFDELVAMMRKRGYRFITLEDALTDPAYAMPDTYAGPAGISWLHRWALTAGRRGDFFAGEPATPRFVLDEAGIESE